MKGNILVVDDEPNARNSLAEILRLEDFRVATAANGEAALEALEQEKFDVMLLDLKMPGMDGVEVLNKIKTNWPKTKVVMITGYSTVDTAVQALRLGAFNFIEKPFTPDMLISAVKEVFGASDDDPKHVTE